jgi:hypothetical protein
MRYINILIHTDEFNKLTENVSLPKVRGLTKEDIHIIIKDNVLSLKTTLVF